MPTQCEMAIKNCIAKSRKFSSGDVFVDVMSESHTSFIVLLSNILSQVKLKHGAVQCFLQHQMPRLVSFGWQYLALKLLANLKFLKARPTSQASFDWWMYNQPLLPEYIYIYIYIHYSFDILKRGSPNCTIQKTTTFAKTISLIQSLLKRHIISLLKQSI